MGERYTGSVEVMGSSPTVSTIAENVDFTAFSAIFLRFKSLKSIVNSKKKANEKLTRHTKNVISYVLPSLALRKLTEFSKTEFIFEISVRFLERTFK